MEEIELLKKKNKRLKQDIAYDNKAIYANIGVILMIAFASLGGGIVTGLVVGNMLKTMALSIGIATLLSVKSIADIAKYNRDIFDCNSQIRANNNGIKKYESILAKEKEKQVELPKKNSNSYKPNKYSKKEEDFTNYLNNLNEEGFFDYNEQNHHKTR